MHTQLSNWNEDSGNTIITTENMTDEQKWHACFHIPDYPEPELWRVEFAPRDFWVAYEDPRFWADTSTHTTPLEVYDLYFQQVEEAAVNAPMAAAVLRKLFYQRDIAGRHIVYVSQALEHIRVVTGLPNVQPADSKAEQLRKQERKLERAAQRKEEAAGKAERKLAWDKKLEDYRKRKAGLMEHEQLIKKAKADMKTAMVEAEANLRTYKLNWKAHIAELEAKLKELKNLPIENWL